MSPALALLGRIIEWRKRTAIESDPSPPKQKKAKPVVRTLPSGAMTNDVESQKADEEEDQNEEEYQHEEEDQHEEEEDQHEEEEEQKEEQQQTILSLQMPDPEIESLSASLEQIDLGPDYTKTFYDLFGGKEEECLTLPEFTKVNRGTLVLIMYRKNRMATYLNSRWVLSDSATDVPIDMLD